MGERRPWVDVASVLFPGPSRGPRELDPARSMTTIFTSERRVVSSSLDARMLRQKCVSKTVGMCSGFVERTRIRCSGATHGKMVLNALWGLCCLALTCAPGKGGGERKARVCLRGNQCTGPWPDGQIDEAGLDSRAFVAAGVPGLLALIRSLHATRSHWVVGTIGWVWSMQLHAVHAVLKRLRSERSMLSRGGWYVGDGEYVVGAMLHVVFM